MRAAGTEIVLISPDNREDTEKFWKKIGQKPDMTIVLDPVFDVIKKLQLFKKNDENGEAVPATFIIDKQGLLRFKYIPLHYSDRPPIKHIYEILSILNEK